MQQAENAEKITENLILVPAANSHWSDPHLILDGDKYSYFRGCPGGLSVFIKNGAPAELTQTDIETLNARCDNTEKPRNRQVKKNIATSLKRYFGEMAIHIYEFGCGKFPITRQFGDRNGLSYHGIERDRNHIAELHRMDIPASDWAAAMKHPAPADRPSICVAIYALHFMVSSKLPRRISHLTNDQGFFVGNFYVDPTEQRSSKQRHALGNMIKNADMSYIVVDDPRNRANQYWVIGRSGNVSPLHRYAEVLEDILPKRKASPAPAL